MVVRVDHSKKEAKLSLRAYDALQVLEAKEKAEIEKKCLSLFLNSLS